MSTVNANQLIRRNTFLLPRQLAAALTQGGKKWELIISIREFGSGSLPGPRPRTMTENRPNSSCNRNQMIGKAVLGQFLDGPPKARGKGGKKNRKQKKKNKNKPTKSKPAKPALPERPKQNSALKPVFRSRKSARMSEASKALTTPAAQMTRAQHFEASVGGNNRKDVPIPGAPPGVRLNVSMKSKNKIPPRKKIQLRS